MTLLSVHLKSRSAHFEGSKVGTLGIYEREERRECSLSPCARFYFLVTTAEIRNILWESGRGIHVVLNLRADGLLK